MASKYEPLEIFLRNQRPSMHKLRLSFHEIENIICSPLPRSALTYRQWWSNQRDLTNRPQTKSWISAGFQVDSVNQQKADGSVTFIRS